MGSTCGYFSELARASKATDANEAIVVAVLGVNGQGLAHIRNFLQQTGVEVAYVCDVDERVIPRAIAAVREFQSRPPKIARDLREVLDDPAVDAISIALPNHWHAPATILGCAAGKHVYVEKPCSHTAEEGELAVRASRKYDRIVQMGNQRRSRAHYIKAIEQLRGGAIGNVMFSRTWYNNRRDSIGTGVPVSPPKELDFSLWQGPAPERPFKSNLLHYNWHWHWHWGDGELGNNGIHAIDVARWGLSVEFPTRVSSAGGRYRFQDDQETPDTHSVTFEFDEKMITWEGLSWSPYGPGGSQFGISFHGEGGSVHLDDAGYTIFDLKNKPMANVSQSNGDSEHYANFVEAIRTSRRPSSDIEDAHKSTLLCHLGNISHRVSRSIRTNPNDGHIVDDGAAQKLWTREYRKGWSPEGAS